MLDPASVPAPTDGFQLGDRVFLITLTDAAGGQISQPAAPLALRYSLSAAEINLAGGDLSLLKIATLVGDTWVALSCTPAASMLDCSVPHLSVFALVVAPVPADRLDSPLANGWFTKQTKARRRGPLGFDVVDDATASFWTEFQRLGGVEHLGYPISQRFQYGGFVTQAFQKLVLQWRPELGQAVPVNVFDELNARGSDGWLESSRQVPRTPDLTQDINQPWEIVSNATRHCWTHTRPQRVLLRLPDGMTRLGLPLQVRTMGR